MLGTPFQQEVLFKLSRLAPVYIVGGAVRDAQLGESNQDVDAVLVLSLEEIENHLRAWGYAPHRIGARHQTVTVFNKAERLDLTGFSGHLLQDALRRDFTINAIYLDVVNGQLIDPLGGLIDLENKLLRACGSPAERLAEDPLRILRLVRIAAQRELLIDAVTWQAAQELLPLLDKVACERVTEELGKLLMLQNVSSGLKLLDELGYWEMYVPELARLKGLVQNRYHSKDAWEHTLQVVANTPPRLLVRLAALFHDSGKWETASHECNVWGLVELRTQEVFVGPFQLIEKNLDKWVGKYVEVLGARLDNYPNFIQVKHISPTARCESGFEWVPEGKRHFLQHERESARLVKKIFPRFRWSMVLPTNGGGNEEDCIFLIANHMVGTLTFMEELRRNGRTGRHRQKARQFAWRYGWNGREFSADRVDALLELWRADFLGGKVRAEGDLALLEQLQAEIRLAIKYLKSRLANLDWSGLKNFTASREVTGVEFGEFKEYIRSIAVLDEDLDLTNEQFLNREYRNFRQNKHHSVNRTSKDKASKDMVSERESH